MKLKALMLALAMTTAVAALPASATDAPELFVVVTSGDSETQAMAMILAGETAKRSIPVRMLLCGPGGDLALKGYQGTAIKPPGKTPQELMQGLMKAGAKVELCAIHLPNSGGKTEADLIEGVTLTRPPVVVDHMMKPNVRYFTF